MEQTASGEHSDLQRNPSVSRTREILQVKEGSTPANTPLPSCHDLRHDLLSGCRRTSAASDVPPTASTAWKRSDDEVRSAALSEPLRVKTSASTQSVNPSVSEILPNRQRRHRRGPEDGESNWGARGARACSSPHTLMPQVYPSTTQSIHVSRYKETRQSSRKTWFYFYVQSHSKISNEDFWCVNQNLMWIWGDLNCRKRNSRMTDRDQTDRTNFIMSAVSSPPVSESSLDSRDFCYTKSLDVFIPCFPPLMLRKSHQGYYLFKDNHYHHRSTHASEDEICSL